MTKITWTRGIACAVFCMMFGVFAFNRATLGATAAASRESRSVVASTRGASSLRRLWRSGRDMRRTTFGSSLLQDDKPVEQVRKNIQVIKGLPSSQLFPLMNFVSASLGVRCNYCHVKHGDDDWVWESDEKGEKQTARRMMQMVLNVNNSNRADFRDNAVTCYTCHRGQTEPVGIPSLPLAVSGHEPNVNADTPGVKSSEALPSAEQILNRYVQAVGGRESAAKLRSRVLKGTREASQGRSWPIEITIKEPDKFLIVANTPQGIVRQSVNNSSGWTQSSRGVRALTPAELEQIKNNAKVYDVIQIREAAPGMRVAGREKVGERDALVIEWTPARGVTEKLYFDAQTNLLLRRLTLAETVLLPIPGQIDFEDYREVDGVKVPFTVRISEIDTYFSSTRKFGEIKHNVAVDETTFNMPTTTAAPGPK